MDKQLTDSEIVKAFECCYLDKPCEECPLCKLEHADKKCFGGDPSALSRMVLDLINRQNAEIEKLKAKCENTQVGYNFLKDELEETKKRNRDLVYAIKSYKAEAYKECIEKAKSEIDSQSHSRSLEASGERFRIHKILDNILKEMVGDINDE